MFCHKKPLFRARSGAWALSALGLSNNKLSDNNLASEPVENRTFLNQSQARKL